MSQAGCEISEQRTGAVEYMRASSGENPCPAITTLLRTKQKDRRFVVIAEIPFKNNKDVDSDRADEIA